MNSLEDTQIIDKRDMTETVEDVRETRLSGLNTDTCRNVMRWLLDL